jgi:hypothetical protein
MNTDKFTPTQDRMRLAPDVEPVEASERRVHAAAAWLVLSLPPEGGVPGDSVKHTPRRTGRMLSYSNKFAAFSRHDRNFPLLNTF